MPEGDTVYLAARKLDAALVGRVLTRGELRVPAHATAALAGMTITANVTWGSTCSPGSTPGSRCTRISGWTAPGRFFAQAVVPAG